MRVVTYNILDGGEGRADPLAEVLGAQRADVIAVLEADVPAVVDRIARRLKMDYAVGEGPRHTSALLSRWPIRQSINHAAFEPALTRSFLEAVVVAPGGRELPIGVLHLPAGATDAAETCRVDELAVVLGLLDEHRAAARPHLLCGDFNSHAGYQRIDPARCTAQTQTAWPSNGDRLPTRVIDAMLGNGYLDTYHAIHDERAAMVGSFTTQRSGQRVDYVFSFGIPANGVRAAWVEQDRLARYASDHFPVGAELGWE